MICILHLQNFRYDYIRIFFRKNTTSQKIIAGAKPPRAPPTPLRALDFEVATCEK